MKLMKKSGPWTAAVVRVAIGVLVRPMGGELGVLVTRRPPGVALGGYWEFPGGKLEPGEAPEQCLVREFKEEVGLRVRAVTAMTVIEHRYDHAVVRLHPFLCTCQAHQIAEGGLLKGVEHRWVRVSDLKRYRFPLANQGLIQALMGQDGDGMNPVQEPGVGPCG